MAALASTTPPKIGVVVDIILQNELSMQQQIDALKDRTEAEIEQALEMVDDREQLQALMDTIGAVEHPVLAAKLLAAFEKLPKSELNNPKVEALKARENAAQL